MSKQTVYLCGGINALSDSDARDWREAAKELLGQRFQILDPMRRDYRGQEAVAWRQIVRGDLTDIALSDILLINASRPSWGTGMEMPYARMLGKTNLAFGAGEKPSPWLVYHATLYVDLEEACRALLV